MIDVKTEIVFVIRGWRRGEAVFFVGREEDGGGMLERDWTNDPYFAKKFKTYLEAEDFLNSGLRTNWGGYFSIEKYYLKR